MAEPAGLQDRRLAGRRLLAWLADLLRIVLLPLALIPLGLLLNRAGVDFGQAGWNLVGFLLLIVPVTLWLAWSEATPRGATPGKRWQKLRVVDARTREPVSISRALLRNTLKVALPWELGHTVAFGFATTFAAGGSGVIAPWLTVVTIACYALMIIYVVSLFIASGRTPYDWLSGTAVISRS